MTTSEKRKTRSGFSLVELLIAVVVLGILAMMVLNSGSAAQYKARVTTAMSALENYQTAFNTVVLENPGVMKDREEAWGDDGSGYTTKTAMERLVIKMNKLLDEKLVFVWDNVSNYYRSTSTDPWGGYYILMEFPHPEGDNSGYDPTAGIGLSAMRCSIWASGVDENVVMQHKVSENSIGCTFLYQKGIPLCVYHGVEDTEAGRPYTGWQLQYS